MKPPIDSVRLTATERDLLLKIKRKTGIDSWNVLCRWGLTLGLKSKSKSIRKTHEKRDAIEIKWETFAGKQSDFLSALIHIGILKYKTELPDIELTEYFYSVLEEGIRTLSASLDKTNQNLNSLIISDHLTESLAEAE